MDLRRAPASPAGLPRISRILFSLALAAFVLAGWALTAGCGSSDSGSPQGLSAPSAAASAAGPSSPTTSPAAHTDATAQPAATRVLAATAVVQRFCRLVDQRRYVAARRLLTAPTVWPLRELHAVRGIQFESAQAWGEPADDEVTLLVGFTATVTWRSPLTAGINDVFFTLTRRVTTGEWLIAAVSTSP